MIIDLEKSDLSDEFYSSGSEKKIEDLKIQDNIFVDEPMIPN